MKYGICEWNVPEKGEACFETIKKAGLEGIELEYTDDLLERAEEYLAWSQKYGVILTAIGVNVCCDFCIFKKINETRFLSVIEGTCKAADKMGIPLFHIPTFFESEIKSETDFLTVVSLFQKACDIAKKYGITVGSENKLSATSNLRLLKEVNRENLKIYFDTQNPQVMAGYNACEILEAVSGNICEVHIKDCVMGGDKSAIVSTGETNFEEIIALLLQKGYDKWMLFENDYVNMKAPEKLDTPLSRMEHDLSTIKALVEKYSA